MDHRVHSLCTGLHDAIPTTNWLHIPFSIPCTLTPLEFTPHPGAHQVDNGADLKNHLLELVIYHYTTVYLWSQPLSRRSSKYFGLHFFSFSFCHFRSRGIWQKHYRKTNEVSILLIFFNFNVQYSTTVGYLYCRCSVWIEYRQVSISVSPDTLIKFWQIKYMDWNNDTLYLNTSSTVCILLICETFWVIVQLALLYSMCCESQW